MPKQTGNLGRRWYVIRTQSGYEENVANNLKQRIESMDMEDKIFDVLIPTEKKIKIKNGKRKVITEKISDATANAYATDLGLLCKPSSRLSLGPSPSASRRNVMARS